MTVGLLDLGSGADPWFFLEFTEAGGVSRRESLASCVTARLGDALPAQSFQWTKGASHLPGSWRKATAGMASATTTAPTVPIAVSQRAVPAQRRAPAVRGKREARPGERGEGRARVRGRQPSGIIGS
jgi:hypothetical protein